MTLNTLMYIHGTRDRETQSKRRPSLNIEVYFSIKKEEAKERVKDQNRIDTLLLPTILRSLRGSAYSKGRNSVDGFHSLYCS